MAFLTFGPEICQNLEEAASRSWLLTNSLGSYSSSTIPLCHTRSSQGLLVVSMRPHPLSESTRVVLLSNLDDVLVLGEDRFPLTTQRYAEGLLIQGFSHLVSFDLRPHPVLTYHVEDVILEKEILLGWSENSLLVRYRLMAGRLSGIRLDLRPLLAYRSVAELRHDMSAVHPALESGRNKIRVASHAALPPLYFTHHAVIVDKTLQAYNNVEYAEEAGRAKDPHEDLVSPFALHYVFEHRTDIELAISTQDHGALTSADKFTKSEDARRKKLLSHERIHRPLFQVLRDTADLFFVSRGRDLFAIVRRFPHMEECLSDMLRALPGLALAAGWYERAWGVLAYTAQFFKRGSLPDRLGSDGEEVWESCDGALWWILACYEYGEASEDFARVEKRLYPLVRSVISHHLSGQAPGVAVTQEGLLQLKGAQSSDGSMPVELQALWYNALKTADAFAVKFRDQKMAAQASALARRVEDAVNQLFWLPDAGYYAACLRDGVQDRRLRPGQVFLMSLPFAVAPAERWQQVLSALEKNLMTPFGLRSLSREDPAYQGRVTHALGSERLEASAGAVDAGSLGPYCIARLKAFGYTPSSQSALARMLRPLEDHVRNRGLGGISEYFDGDPPHAPHGDPWSAVAVAEVLRAIAALDEQKSGLVDTSEAFRG